MEAVARTFKPIWRVRNGFKIQNLGDHKFLFIFDNKPNANRVLNNESCSFDKHSVVLQRYSTYILLQDFSLNETTLWIQVHNIPVSYMNRETAEDICMVARKVISSSGDPDSGGGGFIWVRVTVDVACPFCRGKVVTLESGAKTWVSFKYKQLPNLCYWCGCLDHDDKDYEVWIDSDGTLDLKKKKNMIRVFELKQFIPLIRM